MLFIGFLRATSLASMHIFSTNASSACLRGCYTFFARKRLANKKPNRHRSPNGPDRALPTAPRPRNDRTRRARVSTPVYRASDTSLERQGAYSSLATSTNARNWPKPCSAVLSSCPPPARQRCGRVPHRLAPGCVSCAQPRSGNNCCRSGDAGKATEAPPAPQSGSRSARERADFPRTGRPHAACGRTVKKGKSGLFSGLAGALRTVPGPQTVGGRSACAEAGSAGAVAAGRRGRAGRARPRPGRLLRPREGAPRPSGELTSAAPGVKQARGRPTASSASGPCAPLNRGLVAIREARSVLSSLFPDLLLGFQPLRELKNRGVSVAV